MENMTFEQAKNRLDAIIDSLQNPELALDEALKLYEEGMKLHQTCEKLLNEATNQYQTINDQLK